MHPAIKDLTLREKAELVSGGSFWTSRGVERLGIRSAVLTDGPHGVRRQRAEADHLGLNDSEPATSFPTAAASGSSWDPQLLEEMGAALGVEARALDVDILLGPGVNIKRSPLCGRNFEYFSEDPLLSGALGAAWVRGLQARGVGASVKHFAANNQETDRMRVSAEVDERTLREIYLPAFERVVREARPATVMCSYNRINGVYASQNHWLLTEVLRDEWQYDGYVVSDWGAVTDPVAALAAGLDLEMPSTGGTSPALIEAAVQEGRLDLATLDQAVTRILEVHDRFSPGERHAPDLDAHHALARRIAVESSVLLTNTSGILPLDPTGGGDIAVIGAFAEQPRYQGAGSSHIIPTRLDNAVEAIGAATSRTISVAQGFRLDGEQDQALLDEAVRVAEAASVVVLFLGLPDDAESEGFDREHLELPDVQLRLADAVIDANPSTIVVLSNGAVVSLERLRGRAAAILEMWLAGQAAGSAAADMLFGDVEPGGRLAETIPLALAHNPAHVNWPGSDGVVRYGEGTAVGYRWYDTTERDVAFPFGFGLGYTTFAYSDLRVDVADPTAAHAAVEVTVENVGERPGAEVVQMYVGEERPAVLRAPRELKGFEKIRLEPGERRTVRFELDERAFAYWGATGWTVTPGRFTIAVGRNSRDLVAEQTIRLDVAAPVVPLHRDATVGEWLSHPVGSSVARAFFAQLGPAAAALEDPESIRMVESIPLTTMIGFTVDAKEQPSSPAEVVERMLAEVQSASGRTT